MNKIYVATSWRNPVQSYMVKILKLHGHRVYDFREKGFHWSDIDINWKHWTKEEYNSFLDHYMAEKGFLQDFDAMKWADIFIGIQPFGRSASIEMGWAAGQGKKTILLLADGEPELMVKIFDHICCNLDEVLNIIGRKENCNDKDKQN